MIQRLFDIFRKKNQVVNYLDVRIEQAKYDFKNHFMVAFLGEKYSGKTIACTLINDALIQHYVKFTNNEWRATSTHGSIKIQQISNDLADGKFLPKTLFAEPTPITLELFSTLRGSRIEIILNDMANEKSRDIFIENYTDVDKRLEEIFDTAMIDGKDYGSLASVIFANMYIITIDCSKFSDKDKIKIEDATIGDSICRLYEIKIEWVMQLTVEFMIQ